MPKSTGKVRIGTFTTHAKSDEIIWRTVNLGSAGQIFQYGLEKNKLVIEWNIAHPFYQKYVAHAEKEQVYAVDLVVMALASALIKYIQMDDEHGLAMSDNFVESVSKNLRTMCI